MFILKGFASGLAVQKSLAVIANFSNPRFYRAGIRTMSATSIGTGPYAGHKNRLGLEKSPYLLQHADNPVDWFPWGEEAFTKAKAENKLIFLSVGYSTCHWCHVMERESFDNKEIGSILSELFVPVKVDREERPDVDKVYMTFIQATTRQGGWPMSVWLTPDLQPVVGGMYFPPVDRYGRPGFKSVLIGVASQWAERRDDLKKQGEMMVELLREVTARKPSETSTPGTLTARDITDKCYSMLAGQYEEKYGGFGTQPKFPHPANFTYLFAKHAHCSDTVEGQRALEMCVHTLRCMAKGGIHDHVAQGFHRYSTDDEWHVPHFEKMLYDQAQLTLAYTEAYQITKEEEFAEVVRDILTYVNRDLSHKSGGYYSAEDADSLPTSEETEKKEGAFCVWTEDEVHRLLSKPVTDTSITQADVFCAHYGVKSQGNVTPEKDPHGELVGQNVLMEQGDMGETAQKLEISESQVLTALREGREKLYAERQKRPAPHLDNKMVASWNGLMVCGLARAARVFGGKHGYVDRLSSAVHFLRTHMYNQDTCRLLHCAYVTQDDDVTQLSTPISGFADDYAFVIWGLLEAYDTLQDTDLLLWAEKLQATQDLLFWDAENHGYYATTDEDADILVRMKDDQDGAEPSTNSVSADNLMRLSLLLDRPELYEQAENMIKTFTEKLSKMPIAMPHLCSVMMHMEATPIQIRLAGDLEAEDTRAMLDCIRGLHLPHHVLQVAPLHGAHSARGERLPQLSDVLPVDGAAAAYVCRQQTCAPSVTTPEQLRHLLSKPANVKL